MGMGMGRGTGTLEKVARALPMAIALAGLAPAAQAVDLAVVGLFPNKAVIMVDGAGPKTASVGQKVADGVTLLSVERDGATFDIGGKRKTIQLGQASTRSTANTSVALTADTRGHYFVDGRVNGLALRFMVDTGATLVALSSVDAERLGLNYLAGPAMRMNTANGAVKAWRVRLDTLQVGGIALNNVEAAVVESPSMPALLGMNVLNRMEMRQVGETMTLTKRY